MMPGVPLWTLRLWGRRRLAAVLLFPLVWGCSSSDQTAWRGYYYANVISNAEPLTKGPFASSGQCIAAMRGLLRQAPNTASFACGRGCEASGNGLISTCREVAR